jgi:hypothetical protein
VHPESNRGSAQNRFLFSRFQQLDLLLALACWLLLAAAVMALPGPLPGPLLALLALLATALPVGEAGIIGLSIDIED